MAPTVKVGSMATTATTTFSPVRPGSLSIPSLTPNALQSAHLLHSSSFPPLLASTIKRNQPSLSARSQASPLALVQWKPADPMSDPMVDHSYQNHQPAMMKKSFREAVAGPSGNKVNEPVSSKWTDQLDVSFSSTKLRPLSSHNGEPALVLTKEEKEQLAKPYQYTLIGKFSNGKPSMVAIRKEILAASFSGEVYSGLLDYRHVFFKFELEDDFHRMWSRRIWNFSGFPARLFKWSPDFSTDCESSMAPVWIKLPQLPLHLFGKETLLSIASAVGTPLRVDRATAYADKILRPSEARVLVEMDVLAPHPHRVWIGTPDEDKWQNIEIEDLPEYCTNCRKMGHSQSQCNPNRRDSRSEEIRKGKKKMWIPIVKNCGQISEPTKEAIKNKGKKTASYEAYCETNQEARQEDVSQEEVALSEPHQETKHAAATIPKMNKSGEVQECSNNAVLITDQQGAYIAQGDQVMNEVESPKKKGVEQEANAQFLANLGQFLELLNKQEGESDELDKSVEFPLPIIEPSLQKATDLVSTTRLNTEAINVTKTGVEGKEDSSAIPTTVQPHDDLMKAVDMEPELPQQSACSHNDIQLYIELPIPQPINVRVNLEEGESSNLHKSNSTSNIAHLQDIPTVSEPDMDWEDQWTENSYEEESEDELGNFLSKMEKRQKPSRQSKHMEALLSPRRLTGRNPFICYSEGAETSGGATAPTEDFSNQFAAGLGSVLVDASEVDDEEAIAKGVLAGRKVKTPFGSGNYLAHSFSRQKLEEDKKRKYGMSDRVLRSMIKTL